MPSFKNGAGPVLITIHEADRRDIKLEQIIQPTGYVSLKPSGECVIRSIEKLLFLKEHILVQDGESDFDNIWIFDNSGNFKQSIGRQQPGEEFGANNMAAWGDEISLLFPARHAFYTYNSPDDQPSVLKNGAFGDMVERMENGFYVLYNEHNSTETTGMHYIIIYDKDGNIVKKEMPYHADKEIRGYTYTGFLSRSGNDIWFSPPLSNLVYKVEAQDCVPRFQFDFGKNNLPADLAACSPGGSEMGGYGFLNERFVKNGPFIQFEYQVNRRVCKGLFDSNTGQSVNLRHIQGDCFSKLMSNGTVMPKDDDEFVLTIRTEQVQFLADNDLIDLEALNNSCKGLGNTLTKAALDGNPVLIYFTYKQGAGIPKR